MEVWIMARWTALSRRFGILFLGLMLTIGLIGAQTVGARALPQPGSVNPIAGQPPGICYPCFWGITGMQEKTLFYASNYPNLAMVDMSWNFNGQATNVSYVVQAAGAPAPAANAYFSMPLQANGHYDVYQYLTKGAQYSLYVHVVDHYGTSYAQVYTFWVS
jgi:hypothetical protein